MVNKALKYLNNTINQDKLFKSINEDIKEIIKPYNFKKVVHIESYDTGELTIEIQDPLPTGLIKELDDYMGMEGVLEKTHYHMDLVYKLTKGF